MTKTPTKLETYKTEMLARKAAKLGISVEQMLADSERQVARDRRTFDLRTDRRIGRAVIAAHAATRGNTFSVSV